MHRRDFLKSLAAVGCLTLPLLKPRAARASADTFSGPFLITLQARGGWDPTMFCDGKLANSALQLPYQQPETLGRFTYAPLSLSDGAVRLDGVKEFLTDLGSRLVVVNGIDTQTNSHSTGMKHVWSGRSFEQLPALAALYAAAKVGELKVPLPYLSRGGYEDAGGVVQLTRMFSPAVLRTVARPNTTPDGSLWHDATTYDRIERASAARLGRLTASGLLPAQESNATRLAQAREGAAGLEALATALPSTLITTRTAFPELNFDDPRLTNWLQSVQTALHAFSVGVALSANVSTDGSSFDTHDSHDTKHAAELGKFMLLIRYLFRLADQLGLSDRLFVVIGSDFGRTPTYNAARGKDHWNVTSMILSGPRMPGGSVIGGTDEQLRPMRMSTRERGKLLADSDQTGERILPGHVHRALRRTLGIEGSDVVKQFPLSVPRPLDDLFSPG